MAVDRGSIQVEGLQQTIRELQALGEDKAEIQEANLAAARTLIAAAVPLVPVLTGNLRSTLKPAKTTNYAAARAGSARVPYANPIHWGWAKSAKTGQRKNIKPQPFFARALGYTKAEIIANYDKKMQQLIDKHKLGDKD